MCKIPFLLFACKGADQTCLWFFFCLFFPLSFYLDFMKWKQWAHVMAFWLALTIARPCACLVRIWWDKLRNKKKKKKKGAVFPAERMPQSHCPFNLADFKTVQFSLLPTAGNIDPANALALNRCWRKIIRIKMMYPLCFVKLGPKWTSLWSWLRILFQSAFYFLFHSILWTPPPWCVLHGCMNRYREDISFCPLTLCICSSSSCLPFTLLLRQTKQKQKHCRPL